jgi:predicted HTH domain antitoxin
MTLSIELSARIEEALKQTASDPAALVKEAAVIELYRRGAITLHELSEALGIARIEADGVLKAKGVFEGTCSLEDLEEDRRTLDRLFAARK